jgi:hypothetical protein
MTAMNRRDFFKGTVVSLASAGLESSPLVSGAESANIATLGNDQLDWEFSMADKRIVGTFLRNRVSGRNYSLKAASELELIFSAARERIEIFSWRCRFGPDNDDARPENEEGFQKGFQQSGFDDTDWETCSNLTLQDLGPVKNLPFNQGRPAVVFRGYGWFRTHFLLPEYARGKEIILNLGGYDVTDWKETWVYLNGQEVGRRSSEGPWRSPGEFRLVPGSQVYQSLEIGNSKSNLLAVRTNSYDRHIEGLRDEQMDRYIFDPILYDQFLTIGETYQFVSDFEVTSTRIRDSVGRKTLVVEMINREAQITVTLHYELEGNIRRKWAEIRNDGPENKLLLDVHLDNFQVEGSLAEGGYGYPLTINNEIFLAVEHPSGLNCWHGQQILLTHFPGKWLNPGDSFRSHNAIAGVNAADNANQGFLQYLETHTVRKKKILALYDPFGITAFTEGMSWALNDTQNLGTLNLLAEWQKKGVRFDYYIPDMSLDTTSDLKRFRLFSFPDGPSEVIQQVNELGMKFGQWFCVSYGAWSNYRYPKTAPSRIPVPTGNTPDPLFRHGHITGFQNKMQLCVASDPYFNMLKEAVTHHIKENHVELVKFDVGHYYCNSTEHGHLPGKYSTESSFNHLLDLAKAARAAHSNTFVVWYWGAYSPFFALHGDVIFDIRISMEACSTGDYPSLFFRDAVNQALDQGSQFAKWLPPMNHDSLGVWLANNSWGNYMETERWQEALIMDLARGNLLFPQIWSDLYNLEEHDVDWLARIQSVVKCNEPVFLTNRHSIGDPWKNAIYGYSYFEGNHGFVFLNNMSFESRRTQFRLGKEIGLTTGIGIFRLRSHHPAEELLVRNGERDYMAGETVEFQMRPFEVNMIEVLPAERLNPSLPERPTLETSRIYSYPLSAVKTQDSKALTVLFADAEKLLGQGLKRGQATFEIRLPEYSGGRYHLAIVCTFRTNGRWWRREQMSETVQAIAMVDGLVVEFTRTPDFRQVSNNQWNPWIVFSAPLPKMFSGRPLRFGVSSYLPQGVDMSTQVWAIKEWWKPRMRSLPNYWI